MSWYVTGTAYNNRPFVAGAGASTISPVVYFEDRNNGGAITDDAENPEVLQRELYYPFGMPLDNRWSKPAPALTPVQDFLYNGKEYETTRVGWGRGPSYKPNWYFHGARWYDPAVGRFTGVDPIAAQFAHVSGFN